VCSRYSTDQPAQHGGARRGQRLRKGDELASSASSASGAPSAGLVFVRGGMWAFDLFEGPSARSFAFSA